MVTSNGAKPIGVRHCGVAPHRLRTAVICAVPRVRARKVRGGPIHVVPGRHTMDIGDTPGARTDGSVETGAEGNGNRAAITSVPTVTWKVIPFCAGVTVIVPCPTLGGGVGGLGRAEEEGGVVVVSGADGLGRPWAEGRSPDADGESEGPLPPGTPVTVSEAAP